MNASATADLNDYEYREIHTEMVAVINAMPGRNKKFTKDDSLSRLCWSCDVFPDHVNFRLSREIERAIIGRSTGPLFIEPR